eukprot:Opistho-2@53137
MWRARLCLRTFSTAKASPVQTTERFPARPKAQSQRVEEKAVQASHPGDRVPAQRGCLLPKYASPPPPPRLTGVVVAAVAVAVVAVVVVVVVVWVVVVVVAVPSPSFWRPPPKPQLVWMHRPAFVRKVLAGVAVAARARGVIVDGRWMSRAPAALQL